MSTEQFLLPLVVIGLVVLTLVLSSIARRYQQHQAARRSVVQRMELAIRWLERLRARLQPLPLGRVVQQAIAADILDRYRMISRVFRRYPDLARLLAQAEARLADPAAQPSGAVPVIMADEELASLLTDLGELSSYFRDRGTLHPLAADQAEQVLGQLAECRCELLAQHYHAHFRDLQAAGEHTAGRAQLLHLLELLRSNQPVTPRLRELEKAALDALEAAVPATEAAPVDATPRQASS